MSSKNKKFNYKVKAGCLDCGRTWKTKAKPDGKAPRRCHGKNGCGKKSISLHKVWKRIDGGWVLIKDKTGKSKSSSGDRRF